MILQKTKFEVISEIQNALRRKGYPVKVDFSEPREGADLGLKLYIEAPRSWSLEKEIGSTIWEILDRYGRGCLKIAKPNKKAYPLRYESEETQLQQSPQTHQTLYAPERTGST